jgi:hypothetical protein
VLLQGVRDAVDGNEPSVNPRERRIALKQIKDKRAQANLEKSAAFLEENTKKIRRSNPTQRTAIQRD